MPSASWRASPLAQAAMPRGIGAVIQNVLPKAKIQGRDQAGSHAQAVWRRNRRQPKCLFAYAIQSDGEKDVCFASRQSPTAIHPFIDQPPLPDGTSPLEIWMVLKLIKAAKEQEHHSSQVLADTSFGWAFLQPREAILPPHHILLHGLGNLPPDWGSRSTACTTHLHELILSCVISLTVLRRKFIFPSLSLVFSLLWSIFLATSHAAPPNPDLRWTGVAACNWSCPSRPWNKIPCSFTVLFKQQQAKSSS